MDLDGLKNINLIATDSTLSGRALPRRHDSPAELPVDPGLAGIVEITKLTTPGCVSMPREHETRKNSAAMKRELKEIAETKEAKRKKRRHRRPLCARTTFLFLDFLYLLHVSRFHFQPA